MKMSLCLEEQLLFNYFKIVNVSNYEETDNAFREIISSSGNFDYSLTPLDTVLKHINGVLKNYDLEIMEAIDELSSRKIHCLITTNNNSVAQRASFYDKQTCEFLSKIIRACVTSESGFVSEINCLNFTVSQKSSKTSLQDSLRRLIKDKWVVSQNGIISLGMRSKLELEPFIKKQYPNHVKYCVLCKMFLMQGFTCPECDSRAHSHCIRRFCEMNKLTPLSNVCPICKEEIHLTNDKGMGNNADTAEPPAKRSKRHM